MFCCCFRLNLLVQNKQSNVLQLSLCSEWIWTAVTYKHQPVSSILSHLLRFPAGSLAECLAVCKHFPSCGSLALIQLRWDQWDCPTIRVSGVVEYSGKANWCVAPWIESWTWREGISWDFSVIFFFRICLYLYIYIHIYMFIFVYVCMCICICIYHMRCDSI